MSRFSEIQPYAVFLRQAPPDIGLLELVGLVRASFERDRDCITVIGALVAHVLTDTLYEDEHGKKWMGGSYKHPLYERLRLYAEVELESFVQLGFGDCRPCAMLLSLLLGHVGIETDWLYLDIEYELQSEGSIIEPHAMLVWEGVVIDCYAPMLHGVPVAELIAPGGTSQTCERSGREPGLPLFHACGVPDAGLMVRFCAEREEPSPVVGRPPPS